MIMKQIIVTILCFCSVLFASAQEYQMKDLLSKQWRLDFNPSVYYTFTTDSVTFHVEGRDNRTLDIPLPYCLSATNDSVYEKAKVGKIQSGKHIKTFQEVCPKGKKEVFITVYTIKELTDTKLVLVNGSEERTLYNLPKDQVPKVDRPHSSPKKIAANPKTVLSPKSQEEREKELIRRVEEQLTGKK